MYISLNVRKVIDSKIKRAKRGYSQFLIDLGDQIGVSPSLFDKNIQLNAQSYLGLNQIALKFNFVGGV